MLTAVQRVSKICLADRYESDGQVTYLFLFIYLRQLYHREVNKLASRAARHVEFSGGQSNIDYKAIVKSMGRYV